MNATEQPPLTDQQLTEIEQLTNAATPGPWTVSENYFDVLDADGDQLASYWNPTSEARNGEFIAAARTALPALVAEVRRLRAAPAVSPSAPADRPALRERIAAAIWERQNPGRRYADCEYRWRADAEADAHAVLAVLPPPVDRAAVLLELEQRYRQHARDSVHPDFGAAYAAVANDLSRMAGEAPQPETQARCGAWGGCTLPSGHNVGQADIPENHQPAAGPHPEPGVVAYRSTGGLILRCLRHYPDDDTFREGDLYPVTSEDLPDGGICTYSDCGADVLITPAAGSAEGAQQ